VLRSWSPAWLAEATVTVTVTVTARGSSTPGARRLQVASVVTGPVVVLVTVMPFSGWTLDAVEQCQLFALVWGKRGGSVVQR
jgi:hypothetical protein